MSKRSLLFMLALAGIAASLLCDIQPSSAQTRFAVETPKKPTFDLASTAGVKLAPELRPVLNVDVPFVGVTGKGDPVLQFNPSTSVQDAKSTLRDADFSATLLSNDTDFVPLTRFLVLLSRAPGGSAASPQPASLQNLSVVGSHAGGDFLVIEAPGPIDAASLRRLIQDDAVRYVEPNFPYYLEQAAGAPGPPNDPEYAAGKLWGLKDINAPAAWSRATESTILVATIDSGLDYTHPDLAGNIWNGPNNIHGHDFVSSTDDPKDDNGHGTHVAGIIGAVGNNGIGLVGVTWKTKIMGLKIYGGANAKFAGADAVAQAVDFAIANGVKVINNSWGGPNFSMVIKEAVNRAEAAGILFVAAAGNNYGNDNDALPIYPGSFGNANVIAVEAVDGDDQLSKFSNFGKSSVHIAAPGGGIDSALPGNAYGVSSGTSMATPFVTGAAALIWDLPENRNKKASEIKQMIMDNARPLPALKGRSITGGTLDLSFLAPRAALATTDTHAPAPAESEKLRVTGVLSAPVAAIGAETTGVALESKRGTYEIAPPSAATMQTFNSLAGEEVTVSGVRMPVQGPERSRTLLQSK